MEPQRAAHSSANAAMRCGASSHTWALASAHALSQVRCRAAPLLGAKPQKRKPVATASPATLSAAVTLLAPGIGTTRKPAAATACTRAAPGSETAGVPASLA